MKLFRKLLLGAAMLSCSAWALGQNDHSWQYQDQNDRHAYRDGYNQGRADASSGHSFHPDSHRYHGDDRRDYADGYQSGYNSARHGDHDHGWDRDRDHDHDHDGDHDRDHDGDHDRDHDRDARYGNSGYGQYQNVAQIARENGYRDGVNDGSNDRRTGHSNRPTHDDNFKNASTGYDSSSMGSKQNYKNLYRQGYAQGYQEGYNGRRR